MKLSITTTTLDGVSSTQEIAPVKLEPDKLFTHTFTVPDRLQAISATLSASAEQLSKGLEKTQLNAGRAWQINQIDQTDLVDAGHISKFGNDYVFELLGRNGEPVPDAFANGLSDLDAVLRSSEHKTVLDLSALLAGAA